MEEEASGERAARLCKCLDEKTESVKVDLANARLACVYSLLAQI